MNLQPKIHDSYDVLSFGRSKVNVFLSFGTIFAIDAIGLFNYIS
jgi:hypothetical protein